MAQVDLAAVRAEGRLSVRGAWSQDHGPDDGLPPARQIAAELAAELSELAAWLELGEIRVEPEAPGDLTAALGTALREHSENRP